MSFEIKYLCKFYFNITDPNDNKSFEHSNQVRKLIFRRQKREKEYWNPGNVGILNLIWWNTKGLCHSEYLEDEEYENYLNLFYK